MMHRSDDDAAGWGSRATAALESTWLDIQSWWLTNRTGPDVGEVPDVVCVLASGTELTGLVRHGHFAPERWRLSGSGQLGEVFVAAERFTAGPGAVLGTLLHEAAHALARARGERDTSRQGRYHNSRYRRIAVSLGLHVRRDRQQGWSVTTLTDDTARDYVRALRRLGPLCQEASRTAPPKRERERRGSTRRKLECACPRSLRVSPSVADAGPIVCGVCRAVFE